MIWLHHARAEFEDRGLLSCRKFAEGRLYKGVCSQQGLSTLVCFLVTAVPSRHSR